MLIIAHGKWRNNVALLRLDSDAMSSNHRKCRPKLSLVKSLIAAIAAVQPNER